MSIKFFAKSILWQFRKNKALRRAQKMKKSDNVTIVNMAQVIIETINNTLTAEEKLYVDRIENVRYALSNDSNIVSVQDFGAGNPNSERSDEEMYRGISNMVCVSDICKASKPYFWSLLLFKVIRKFQLQTVLELGTCLGISAAYQASAQVLNQRGKLITMEGAAALASMAKKNFVTLGLTNISVVTGRFQDNLIQILTENQPFDYVFIDGHHDEKATISYFETMLQYLSEHAILVFDDISWSPGMQAAWEKIIENKQIKTVIDLKTMGICILGNASEKKEIFFV